MHACFPYEKDEKEKKKYTLLQEYVLIIRNDISA